MSISIDIHENFHDAADLLYVLRSEVRLKILELIAGEKIYRLKDLYPLFDCRMSNLCQHVKILEDAGLIEKQDLKDGTNGKIIAPIYDNICIKLRNQ